jgi:hypothetical protein
VSVAYHSDDAFCIDVGVIVVMVMVLGDGAMDHGAIITGSSRCANSLLVVVVVYYCIYKYY